MGEPIIRSADGNCERSIGVDDDVVDDSDGGGGESDACCCACCCCCCPFSYPGN